MTERIHLTDEPFIDHYIDGERIYRSSFTKEIVIQILDDQEKAEKWDKIIDHGHDGICNTDVNVILIQENNQLGSELQEVTHREKKLKQKLKKIERITFHAGCGGNSDCILCPIVKILKERNK